jgi:hypothetical protein
MREVGPARVYSLFWANVVLSDKCRYLIKFAVYVMAVPPRARLLASSCFLGKESIDILHSCFYFFEVVSSECSWRICVGLLDRPDVWSPFPSFFDSDSFICAHRLADALTGVGYQSW